MPLVTFLSVVRLSVSIRVPFGVVHEMEMSLGLTPTTVSTTHCREWFAPAIKLPSLSTITAGATRSVVREGSHETIQINTEFY